MSSTTIKYSDLPLAELIADAIQTATLDGFDPWPGRHALPEDLQRHRTNADWMLATAPIRLRGGK